jgi:hypothetical protein
MRKVLFFILFPLCFAACTGNSPATSAAASKDSVTATTVSLPYTATYSSNFVPGKQSDVLTTLNNYKAWQDNDMAALKATMGDSAMLIFPSGYTINTTADSLIKMATKFRDSLSKVDLTIYAWLSNHSVDKNEDWVSVWYKEVDTYKTGKKDSADYEDDNRLKDGKIVYSSSHQQKYKK